MGTGNDGFLCVPWGYYSIIKQVAHRDRNGGLNVKRNRGSPAPDRGLILAQIIYGIFYVFQGGIWDVLWTQN